MTLPRVFLFSWIIENQSEEMREVVVIGTGGAEAQVSSVYRTNALAKTSLKKSAEMQWMTYVLFTKTEF
jgi:hypothetical protein